MSGRAVLVVAPEPLFEDRGTPIAVRHVVEGMIRLGFVVDVLTYPVGPSGEIPGVRVIRAANPCRLRHVPIGLSFRKVVLDLSLVAALRRLLQSGTYACVHAVEEAAFPAALLGPRYGVRVVYDMHSRLRDEMARSFAVFRWAPVGAALRQLERWLLRRVDLVTCSAGLAAGVRAAAPTARVREWMFPGSPPVQRRDSATLRDGLGIPADARLVVYCGTFAPYQGLQTLLDAVPQVRRRVPNTVFLLVGADSASNGSVRPGAALTATGAVRVIERQPRERALQLLAAADVLVSPRDAGDNVPLKIFDYLAAGRPIVATDIPAHRTILGDDLALLVPGSGAGLAKGITALLESPDRSGHFAAAARAYADRQLGGGRFVECLKACYDEVLDGASRHGER